MDIIVDIDGTLADLTHRLHFLEKRDYDGFYGALSKDKVKLNIVETVVNLGMLKSNRIILCSGRPDTYRQETSDWLLVEAGLTCEALYMRAAGDYRKDHIVKAELYDKMLADGYEPSLVIDDRPSVIAMWREKGLDVLQVVGWDEQGEKPEQGQLTILVGPSGAGKSVFVDNMIDTGVWDSASVVSSDQIRQHLCGDWKDQSKNPQVFKALHALVKTRIDNGLPAVVDATNIKTADRVAVANLANDKSKVRYIVINRSVEEKKRDGGWRNEVSIGGVSLIDKHEQTFKSNLKDILQGDGLGIEVIDMRSNK